MPLEEKKSFPLMLWTDPGLDGKAFFELMGFQTAAEARKKPKKAGMAQTEQRLTALQSNFVK